MVVVLGWLDYQAKELMALALFSRFHPQRLFAAGLAWGLISLLAASSALALDGSWNVDASGNWSDTANWSGNVVATGNGFTATFANNITASRTVTLDSSRAVGSLVFGDADPTSAASWILSRTGTETFTLNNSTSSTSFVTVNPLGGNATATISLPVGSGASAPVIEKNGSGTLVFTVSNPFTSKLTITGGTLQVTADNQLGASGSFATDRITLSNGSTLRTGSSFTLNGARGITIGTGGGTLNLNGGALTYAGRFTGIGQTLTTAGSAGLTLTNTTSTVSDVNWDLTGNGTRIFFNSTNALGTGSVQVRNNVRLVSQVAAIGTVANGVTLASGGGISARTAVATFSNVVFPTTGTVVFNKDDSATFGLTISSGASLIGSLSVDTSQQALAAVGDVTLSGIFSGGSGGLTKIGTGTSGKLILGGANTYSGNTTISTGTLSLGAAGSIGNSALISLASAATFDVSAVSGFALGAAQTLGGVGSVVGSVTANGTLSPGLTGAVGTISFGNNLGLGSGAIIAYQLIGTDTTVGGGVNDLSSITGDFTLGGTLNVTETIANSFLSANAGDTWRLFNFTGTLIDNGLSLGSMPALSGGKSFAIDTSVANQVNLAVVPEPASLVTVAIGLAAVGAAGARRRLRRGR